MPESSEKSRSRKKKDQQLPEQDQQYEPTGSVTGSGKSDAPEPKPNRDIERSAEETANPEEFPSWLFELESKAVTVPSETAITENSPNITASSQVSKSTDTSDEVMHEDLPDWLKQDHVIKPQVEQQTIPEDELPDWLKQGLEEMAISPEDMVEPAHLEGATQPESEPGLPGISGVDDALTEEISTVEPAAKGSEPLAEVRLALKDEEQSKAQEERSGLLTKMTGWLLASSQLKRDTSEKPSEEVSESVTVESLATSAEEELADVPEEISAELLTSRLGEFDFESQQDDEALSHFKSSIFADDFDEILADESDTQEVYTSAEVEAGRIGDEQPIDKELRKEILSDIEPSSQSQTAHLSGEEKGGKGFLKGLFGAKKADGSQDPSISDQEIERRLLLGLSAASLSETEPDENSTSLQDDEIAELEQSSVFFQEQGADSSFLADYTDEESSSEEPETYYLTGYEEPEDQLEGEEDLPTESEEGILEEAAAGADRGVGYPEMRELALHDYVETPQEPKGNAVNIFVQKTIRYIEDLSPLQKISLAVLFIVDVGFVALLAVILILSNMPVVAVQPTATPAPTAFINTPFPTQVILPGGWTFNLTPVTLREGLWANQGAEWLQGSEITKWVALPWNKQLEAVVVTFGPDDQIDLVMSNLDRLKYKVESVQEVPVEKVLELNRSTPSLVLILANKDSDTRVVVIGSLVTDE
jgi:hypothetical protein